MRYYLSNYFHFQLLLILWARLDEPCTKREELTAEDIKALYMARFFIIKPRFLVANTVKRVIMFQKNSQLQARGLVLWILGMIL